MFLSGERFALYGLKPNDSNVNQMADWFDDEEVTQLLFAGLYPADPETIRKEWKSSLQNPNEVVFMILNADRQEYQTELIGTAGLYSINWVARTTEFRIFLGDKEFWGQGIGTEVTKCIVKYAFEKLNLNLVWLGANIENGAAVRVYEKAGFVHEGILRQVYYRNGRYYDVKRMSILRGEWDDL